MQGKMNQTQLCMNECSYMGFPRKGVLCARPTEDETKHAKEPLGSL